MTTPFQVKPLEIERVVPLALEPCRQLADTLIVGLRATLKKFHIQGDPTPWEGNATTIDAGRALSARLELSTTPDGTKIGLTIGGTVIGLFRKEVRDAIVAEFDRMEGRE